MTTSKSKQNVQQRKALFSEFIFFKANLLTLLRLVMVFLAVELYSEGCLMISLATTFLSVVLDYVDGIVARMCGQCSFFGQTIDWITDLTTTIAIAHWLSALEPSLSILYSLLVVIQVVYMAADLVSKSKGYKSQQLSNNPFCLVFKVTKIVQDRKFKYSFLGYWNQINFYLCLLARVAFLKTESVFFWWVFILNLPMAITYPLTDITEAITIFETWTEVGNGQEFVVEFEK